MFKRIRWLLCLLVLGIMAFESAEADPNGFDGSQAILTLGNVSYFFTHDGVMRLDSPYVHIGAPDSFDYNGAFIGFSEELEGLGTLKFRGMRHPKRRRTIRRKEISNSPQYRYGYYDGFISIAGHGFVLSDEQRSFWGMGSRRPHPRDLTVEGVGNIDALVKLVKKADAKLSLANKDYGGDAPIVLTTCYGSEIGAALGRKLNGFDYETGLTTGVDGPDGLMSRLVIGHGVKGESDMNAPYRILNLTPGSYKNLPKLVGKYPGIPAPEFTGGYAGSSGFRSSFSSGLRAVANGPSLAANGGEFVTSFYPYSEKQQEILSDFNYGEDEATKYAHELWEYDPDRSYYQAMKDYWVAYMIVVGPQMQFP